MPLLIKRPRMKVDLLNKRPFQLNPLSNKRPLPPFLKRVNFNGEVSNKHPSRIGHAKKEKEMMLIVMKMLYLYPLEVYNFELRFSQNVIKNGCISLSFLVACRLTLAIFPDSLRGTYFPGTTKPILAAIVLLEHVPLKVYFCFLNLCFLK